jgi:hypothetical protein
MFVLVVSALFATLVPVGAAALGVIVARRVGLAIRWQMLVSLVAGILSLLIFPITLWFVACLVAADCI